MKPYIHIHKTAVFCVLLPVIIAGISFSVPTAWAVSSAPPGEDPEETITAVSPPDICLGGSVVLGAQLSDGEGGVTVTFSTGDKTQTDSGGFASVEYEPDSLGPHEFTASAKWYDEEEEEYVPYKEVPGGFNVIDCTEKGEQGSTHDPNATGGDPVNIVTGNMFNIERDLFIPGSGPDLIFERTYNTRAGYHGVLGHGWTHSYNTGLVKDCEDNMGSS